MLKFVICGMEHSGTTLLSDLFRQVLILAYYQGLKYREIADILDIPVGTVKSQLHVALTRLEGLWTSTPALYEP